MKRVDNKSPTKEREVTRAAAIENRHLGRVHGFDTLRALAAIIILAFHYTSRYGQLYGHPDGLALFPRLNIGIPTFLILSGFLNVMILEKSTSILDWSVAKFVRLYPVYWAAGIVTFSVITVFGLPGREIDLQSALVNITMIQQLLHVPHIDGAYWTLQIVLFFYIIVGLVFAARLKNCLTFVFMGLTALHIGDNNFHLFQGMSSETKHIIQSVLVLQHACFFMAGMLIYHMRTRIRTWHLAAMALFFVDIYTTRQWNGSTLLFLLPVIVFLVSRYRVPGIDNGVFKYIATISYALYIIHQNVGFIVIRFAYSQGAHGYLAIVAATTVTVGLASGLTFFVERPVATFFKNRYLSLRTQTVGRPASAAKVATGFELRDG